MPDAALAEQPAGGWFGYKAILVPVKAFARAKRRLAPAMSAAERASLAQAMATRVVSSAAGLPVAVVCDDPEVATWARSLGALVIWEPGRGLNGAVQEAASDLPLATDLRWVTNFPGVTIIPDRRHEGTNVISVPPAAGFTFSYGPGSFARHLAEARRVSLPIRVVYSSPLAWDVDVPDDLTAVTR